MPLPAISPEIIIQVITFFLPFLFSLCFHEFAHAWAAKKFGDNTAEVMGRLTLNPLAHIDWLGTVILPIMSIITRIPLFGWAKPVPVNPRNLSKPKEQMFWIALAGPLSNVLLYVIGLFFYLVLIKAQVALGRPQQEMLYTFLALNLYLAFFNLLPMHPLDGGKVIARFIPRSWDIWLEENQGPLQMALMLLVIFGGLRILALPVQFVLQNSIHLIEGL
jgi:Zn-dependent protease